MRARDAISTQLLEMAAQMLGGSDRARMAIQKAYDLGCINGRLEQASHVEDMLGIEATVTQPRRKSA